MTAIPIRDFLLLAPEIFLAVAGMATLVAGSYGRDNGGNRHRGFSVCTVVALAITGGLVIWLQGGREVPEESRLVGRLRELQGTGCVRARIAVLPTELPSVAASLAHAGLGTIAYPGIGIVYAIGAAGDATIANSPSRARTALEIRARGSGPVGDRRPQAIGLSIDAEDYLDWGERQCGRVSFGERV